MLSNKQIVRKISDKISEKSLGSNYVKPLKGLRKFISNKLFKFIENYERILQKRFPSTFRMVRVFTFGLYFSKLCFKSIFMSFEKFVNYLNNK
jgi:hypothetical protein